MGRPMVSVVSEGKIIENPFGGTNGALSALKNKKPSFFNFNMTKNLVEYHLFWEYVL